MSYSLIEFQVGDGLDVMTQ